MTWRILTYSGNLVLPVLDFFKSKSTSRMENLQLNLPQSSSTCLASIFKDMTEISMARSSLLHRELGSTSFTKSAVTRRIAEMTFKLIRTRSYPCFAVYTCCIQCQRQPYLLALTSALNTAGSSFTPFSAPNRSDTISTSISHPPSLHRFCGRARSLFSHKNISSNLRHTLRSPACTSSAISSQNGRSSSPFVHIIRRAHSSHHPCRSPSVMSSWRCTTASTPKSPTSSGRDSPTRRKTGSPVRIGRDVRRTSRPPPILN